MAEITRNYFENNGRKYFRGNAENVLIGCYGEKKDPVLGESYIDVQNRMKAEAIANRVKPLGTVSVNWNNINKADVGASGSINIFPVKGGRAISGSIASASSGKCKLVGFAVDAGPMTVALNTEADGARKYLADEGKDARVASEVWVVMEAEIADAFAASAGYQVSANVAGLGLDISINAGKSNAKTVTMSSGSTFAYGLHKVQDWNKGKTKVEKLEADYFGMS